MRIGTSAFRAVLAPVLSAAALLAEPAAGQSTARLSVTAQGQQSNGPSANASISADGQVIAFESTASNLVPGDTNATSDVFVVDRRAGTITRASVDSQGNQGNGYSFFANLSPDGRYVAFTSLATNLVPDDTNATYDAFVHDLVTGETIRVSVDSQGNQGNRESAYTSVSVGGRFVAFQSMATNLIPGDTNDLIDVFVRDLYLQQTTRVSVDSQGNQANGESDFASISADGMVVGFYSYATNLVSGDTNGHIDTFVHDRQTGATIRVSLDPQGNQFNADSYMPSLSGDGRFATFLAPPGVFLYDRQTGVSTQVAGGNRPAISADGGTIAFSSTTALVPEDTNGKADVYLYDRLARTIRRASVDSDGNQANGDSIGGNYCYVADGGEAVAFHSTATNLVPGDTNGTSDVFLRRMSCSPPDSGQCLAPPSDMVAWWPLDASPGSWVNDLKLQNGGMRTGAVPGDGIVDGALNFDGVADGVQVSPADLLNFGTRDFSIAAWIATKDAVGSRPIVSKRWPVSRGYTLAIGGGKLVFTLADGSPMTILGARPVADGCWHLAVVTVDRDDPLGGRIYVDGVLDVAANVTGHPYTTSNSTPFLIGATAGSAVSFLGSIDEVQVFARSLNGAEIASLYQAGIMGMCKPPCVSAPQATAWWPLDEPGSLATDVMGCANGMLAGAPLPSHVPGVTSGALSFNRQNWVEIPDADCIDVGTSDFSLEAWILPTGSPFGISSIIDKRTLSTGYHVFLMNSSLGFQLALNGPYVNWVSSVPISLGSWHHVAVTVARTAATGGRLYVDGAQVMVFDPRSMQGNLANSANLLIGGHRDVPLLRFMGSIDEVTLFRSVLSPSDVQAIFAAGTGGKCKP